MSAIIGSDDGSINDCKDGFIRVTDRRYQICQQLKSYLVVAIAATGNGQSSPNVKKRKEAENLFREIVFWAIDGTKLLWRHYLSIPYFYVDAPHDLTTKRHHPFLSSALLTRSLSSKHFQFQMLSSHCIFCLPLLLFPHPCPGELSRQVWQLQWHAHTTLSSVSL